MPQAKSTSSPHALDKAGADPNAAPHTGCVAEACEPAPQSCRGGVVMRMRRGVCMVAVLIRTVMRGCGVRCVLCRSFAKVVLPAIKPHTKRLSAAHVSNLLYAMGKVKVQTSGAFPLRITQAVIQTAPFMTAKQLSSAATGAASWPLSRDLVVRIMRALKPEVLDRIKHHEIQVAEVRPVIILTSIDRPCVLQGRRVYPTLSDPARRAVMCRAVMRARNPPPASQLPGIDSTRQGQQRGGSAGSARDGSVQVEAHV